MCLSLDMTGFCIVTPLGHQTSEARVQKMEKRSLMSSRLMGLRFVPSSCLLVAPL